MSDAEEPYDLDAGPDPATHAAAGPESPPAIRATDDPLASGVVPAVGVGPGDAAFRTPRAEAVLENADVVVGFETVLGYVEDAVAGDALACGYRTEAETLERFAERVADGERGAAVLMGDPNHSGYQFLGKVERAVDAPVRVVPGISSLQVAASRARTPMEATTFVTLHRSGPIDDDLARLREDVGKRHLLVLPRPYDWMPERIAAHLIDAGAAPSLRALVLEHLTQPEESVTRTTLGELSAAFDHAVGADATPAEDGAGAERPGQADTTFSDLSILAVRAD